MAKSQGPQLARVEACGTNRLISLSPETPVSLGNKWRSAGAEQAQVWKALKSDSGLGALQEWTRVGQDEAGRPVSGTFFVYIMVLLWLDVSVFFIL